MPELGVNLISQSQLKETTSIFIEDIVLLVKNKKKLIIGNKIDNLYYLKLKVLKKQE